MNTPEERGALRDAMWALLPRDPATLTHAEIASLHAWAVAVRDAISEHDALFEAYEDRDDLDREKEAEMAILELIGFTTGFTIR